MKARNIRVSNKKEKMVNNNKTTTIKFMLIDAKVGSTNAKTVLFFSFKNKNTKRCLKQMKNTRYKKT